MSWAHSLRQLAGKAIPLKAISKYCSNKLTIMNQVVLRKIRPYLGKRCRELMYVYFPIIVHNYNESKSRSGYGFQLFLARQGNVRCWLLKGNSFQPALLQENFRLLQNTSIFTKGCKNGSLLEKKNQTITKGRAIVVSEES